MELLLQLSHTPVPNVLVIAGIIFLLLAMAGRVGAFLQVPPHKEKMSAVTGVILLFSGVSIYLAPSLAPSSSVSVEALETQQAAPMAVLEQSTSLKLGDECSTSAQCPSGGKYCNPGPHRLVGGNPRNYCLHSSLQCALPGEDGGYYGDTTVVNGEILTCCNPQLFGYEGAWAQFYDQRCNMSGGPSL